MMKWTPILAVTAITTLCFSLSACGDEEDDISSCEELIDVVQDAYDEGCKEFPQCSVCTGSGASGKADGKTEDECQVELDNFNRDAMVNAVVIACSME